MRLRSITPSPLLRWFAAATLVLWIGANVLCQSHCLLGPCADSDDADHHALEMADSHHGDEQAPQPGHQDGSEPAACQTLKSALLGSSPSQPLAPHFAVLYVLAPALLTFDATDIQTTPSFSRQARLREWVFTPEVCLGPAFRSHAPPFSSLT